MNDIVVLENRSGHCIELFLPGYSLLISPRRHKKRQSFPPARDNYLVPLMGSEPGPGFFIIPYVNPVHSDIETVNAVYGLLTAFQPLAYALPSGNGPYRLETGPGESPVLSCTFANTIGSA